VRGITGAQLLKDDLQNRMGALGFQIPTATIDAVVDVVAVVVVGLVVLVVVTVHSQ
jgi:hypothetical protein